MLTRRSFIASTLAILASPIGAALAQTGWPSRLIRVVVPLPPGGSNDLVARLVADRLQAALGQPVIVENKPGGSGNIATEYVARQPADGYTLLVTPSSHVVNPSFFVKLPYDPVKDFEPITQLIQTPFVLTISASMPVASFKEFLDYARANPGKLNYGSAGIGQPHHLAVEMLRTKAGLDVVHVPYKGAAGIVPALLSGELQFTIGAINSLLPHFRSGKLRALAVADSTRTPALPGVPAIGEFVPGYAMNTWTGMLAPAGTPRPIVERLSAEVGRILRDPQVVNDRLVAHGLEPKPTTPERFQEIIKDELVMYAKLAKDASIKPE